MVLGIGLPAGQIAQAMEHFDVPILAGETRHGYIGTRSMKVLHIITGLNNGGAEAVLYRLSTAEKQRGNQHQVVSLMGRGIYADRLEQAGVAVNTVDMPRGRITLGGLLRLYQLVRQARPDVVQTWMYHADLIGGIAARLAGVKAIAWGIRHANHDPAYNSRTTLLIARLCARLSNLVPSKIVSCSVKATQLHRALGYRADKFINIPNGYALEKLKPDAKARRAVREELAIASDAFVCGMVARFDLQKDHQNLISALGQVKQADQQFFCLLVGVGMDDGNMSLLAQLDAAGITENVKLLGARNDIPAVMNALDVHVLSSLGEAFPNVLAEAMACGTPCVSTEVGDAALIIGNHGWVVPAQNPVALAGGLLQAKDLFEKDQLAWSELQRACRAHITANFELNQMCVRYHEAWQMCLQA
jgi:glycosyltransferase involved in cell wall biosynthesis